MSFLADRRVLAGSGAVLAVVLALGAAIFIGHAPHGAQPDNTTDSSNITGSDTGGLKVVMGKAPKVEADTSVRCFVGGQFVGMQTAAECAGKNGVAPGQLDVGLDQSGAIAASAGAGGASLAPLANAATGDDSDDGDTDGAAASGQTAGAGQASQAGGAGDYAAMAPSDCRRFVAGGWRPAGSSVSLDVCVHTLFDGRCPPPGQVAYGHWGALSLRAGSGRIEVASDNRTFHPLAPQYPADCSIPPL